MNDQDLTATSRVPTPIEPTSRSTSSGSDQMQGDNQRSRVEAGTNFPRAIGDVPTTANTPGGPDSPQPTLTPPVAGAIDRVAAGPQQPVSRGTHVDQSTPADGPLSPPRAMRSSTTTTRLPVVDPLLFVHATAHHDLEQQRIASENRLSILIGERDELGNLKPDKDGVVRAFGLDESNPDVARLAGITQALVSLENDAKLGMCRSLRRGSIHPWVKAQVGLGDKQVARLLAAIGDPYWHLAEDRPRTVSELWAYSGLHVLPAGHPTCDDRTSTASGEPTSGPGPSGSAAPGDIDAGRSICAGVAAKRRKGVKANWSTEAKTRAYLCATSCIKQASSPYRAVYLARREHTAATHPDWTPGHSHNDALRITSKAILRDLWREARRLHGHHDLEAAA